MDGIVTLAERKARSVERLKAAAKAVIDDMRIFAHEHGGRFYVFGSAASDRMRYDSDLDILIDVPQEQQLEALLFVEQSGNRHGIPIDAHSVRYVTPEFVARVKAEGILVE